MDEPDACELCRAPVYGYVEQRCCSGYECGCRGEPVSPCWCDACWKKFTDEAEARANTLPGLEHSI